MIISTELPTGLPRSCKDWYDMGATQSCEYPIYSSSNVPKMVCMHTRNFCGSNILQIAIEMAFTDFIFANSPCLLIQIGQ